MDILSHLFIPLIGIYVAEDALEETIRWYKENEWWWWNSVQISSLDHRSV